jgi:hypothetical protein
MTLFKGESVLFSIVTIVLPGGDKCYQAHTMPGEDGGSTGNLNALSRPLDGMARWEVTSNPVGLFWSQDRSIRNRGRSGQASLRMG